MSNFIKHQPCPGCGSKDNCGVWDDGHEWCFGCGYYKSSVPWKKIPKKENKNNDNLLTFPLDTSDNIPVKARNWYQSYQINEQEVMNHKFRWSEEKQWLIMPVYNPVNHVLEMFQARCFGTGPKYFTKGPASKIDHIIGNTANPVLFVVEDLLSAIKIGRIATAMPLWGSTMSDERLVRLSRSYQTLVIWLDMDKTTSALPIQRRAMSVFKRSFMVSARNDPKCINMQFLVQIINQYKNKY